VYEVGKLLPRRYSNLREYGGLTWSPDGEEVALQPACVAGLIITRRGSACSPISRSTRYLVRVIQSPSATSSDVTLPCSSWSRRGLSSGPAFRSVP
jgi:hypothetical protein